MKVAAGLAALSFALAAQAATDDVVRSIDRPFVRKGQPAPAALAPAVVPVLAAPTPSAAPRVARPERWNQWSLLISDVDVGKAFERWARERKQTVRWLVGQDLPIDAAADRIVPEVEDFDQAAAQGSADPELMAAMVKVARAFNRSKAPFVVREYDNAIIVQPRSGARP